MISIERIHINDIYRTIERSDGGSW